MEAASRRRALLASVAAAASLTGLGLVHAVPADAAVKTWIVLPGQQIQAAINQAANGDTVRVYPGVYNENVDFSGKNVTVMSVTGAANTIIDGQALDSTVKFTHGEGPAAKLTGFTVRNGSAAEGAGVHIENSSPSITANTITGNRSCSGGSGISAAFSTAIITRNTITNNSTSPGCSGGSGGGIYIRGAGSVKIVDNKIANNSADSGGGISMNAAGAATIERNRIQDNQATWLDGGGIDMLNDSHPVVRTNLVTGNQAASRGGGIHWLVPAGTPGPTVTSNTVASNTAAGAGQALHGEGFQAAVRVSNNLFTSNAAGAVVCDNWNGPLAFNHNDAFSAAGAGWDAACGNQQANNLAVNPMFFNPAANDFTLPAGSPVIDQGDNAAPGLAATDLSGAARVRDGNGDGRAVTDLGAYER